MADAHLVRTIQENGLIESIGLILDRVRKKEGLGGIEAINLLVSHLSSGSQKGLFGAATSLLDELCEEFALEREAIIEIISDKLRKRYRISKKAYYKLSEAKKLVVPVSIFSPKIGFLEALSLYLRDGLGFSFKDIAKHLKRDPTTIWTAYHKALEKNGIITDASELDVTVPLSTFSNRQLTIFESVVFYLKTKGLTYADIAELLNRDQRNIWSTYARAVKKSGVKEVKQHG